MKNRIVAFIFNITKPFGIRGARVGDPSIGRLVLLVSIVLIGVGLRFHAIDREPLWTDEATTLRYADLPLFQLWSKALDTNPPLYYTLQKYWLLWFGRSERALRSLSAVIGSASILLVYGLGEALFSAGLGLLVAFLLAISPLHIEYSQEARAYTLLAAGSTLAIVGLVRILSVPRTRNGAGIYLPVKEDGISVAPRFFAWSAYVIGMLTGLYAHNTAALLFILASGVLCSWWIVQGDRRFLRHWLLASLIILAAWAWWLPVVIHQTSAELRDFWLETPSLTTAINTAANVYGQIYFWRAQPFVTLGFIGLGIFGTAGLLLRKPWPAIFLALVFVLVPTITYAISLYRPIFMLRTILWPLPAFLAMIALGITLAPSLRVMTAAIALIVGVHGVALSNYYSYAVKGEPWDEVVRVIQGNTTRPAAALFCSADGEIPFSYYAIRSGLLVPMRGIVSSDEPRWRMNVLREPIGHIRTIEPGQIRDFTGPFSGVWLIERLCQASAALRREMDKDYSLVRAEWIGGLKLSFFQRRS